MKHCLLLAARWVVIVAVGFAIGALVPTAIGQSTEANSAARESGEASEPLRAAEKMVVDQTNEFRKAHKREPLSANEQLTKTARYFADFMARTDKYGHDADGRAPAERAARHGYDYCLVAENIAWYESATAVSADVLAGQFMKGWQESPRHRENMLDPGMTES